MKFFLTAIAITFHFSILAQNSERINVQDSLSQDTITIKEVLINAPLTILTPKQWPGSISTLDSMQLESGNTYLLADQLNSLPGVLMQQGTLSTNRITIRGIGSRTPYNSNRIKAYWGNIPLTDGDGVTSIEDIGFNDIQSITVLKGPSSALYGAGLGGVILINPWETITDKEQLTFKSEAASYSTYSNQLSTAINSKKGTSWLTANQLHSDGYRTNSLYNRYNVTLKGRYQVRQHYWHYLYNFRYLYGQIPSSLDSIDFRNNPQKAADSWAAIEGYEKSNRHILNLGLNSSLSNQITNAINVFGSISNLDELRPFNRLDEAKRAIGMREKLSYQSQKLRLEVGLEFMLENNDVQLFGVKDFNWGEQLSRTQLQRNYLNIFSMAEYKINPKLLIQAAFNLNTTQYQSQEKTGLLEKVKHRYPLTVSPHLGINYQLSTVSNLFTSVGHGFSTPSLEEAQLPDGSFNADIKPEEGYHFDIGYRYLSSDATTRIELTAYWMKMTNLLVTKRESEEQFYGVNAGRTNHQGIEVSIQHLVPLKNSNLLQFNASATHSLNRFEEFIDDGNDYSDKHLPGIPAFTIYLSANGKLGKQNIHINYRLNGKQYLNDSNINTYEAFNVLNAKISRTVNIKQVDGAIHFGANNLFNTHYASMVLVNAPSFGNSLPRYYYPALPFNIYFGIQLDF